MIRPHRLGDESTFLGQTCALCKQEFIVDDIIVVCPEDGSRHHANCWEANNNHCTAYGCKGEGEIGVPTPLMGQQPARPRPPTRPRIITQDPAPLSSRPRPTPPPSGGRPQPRPAAARPIPNAPGSKVRTLPAGSFGCLRACLFFVLIAAILAAGLACAGAWFLTEYTANEVGNTPGLPLSGNGITNIGVSLQSLQLLFAGTLVQLMHPS